MASYTKQMMETAAIWLAANPDRNSPFLNIPRERQERDTNAMASKVAELRQRVEAAGSSQAALDEASQLIEEMRALEVQMDADMQKLTSLINVVPEAGKDKTSIDQQFHVDLGRWCLAWARHGYNTFELSPDFTAAMLLTDPAALDISKIQLPFHGFLVLIPSGFSVGIEGGHYTRIHVWSTSEKDVQMLDALTKVEEAIKDLPQEEKLQAVAELRQLAIKKDSTVPALATTGPYIGIHATDGVRAFTTFVELKELTWAVIEDLPDSVSDDNDRRAHHTIQQIVFGLLAYSNAVDGALTRREVARKAKAKAKRVIEGPTPVYWEVGRTVRLDPRLVQAARGGAREIALRIKHRFIVRGHYRNQAHGPQRSLRTSRWIAPFWKGPEEGARIIHTYKPETREAEA